jgi:hypothetical protein
VFISEARQQKFFMESICWRIGLRNCLPVPVKGKGGGLVLYWDDSVTVDLISFGTHHIDVKKNEQFGIKWRCTFVYGEPRVEDRHHMWTLLKRIKPCANEPWLMIGDFNETLWQKEHFSAPRRGERQMAESRNVLSFCDLHDLGYKGVPWTFDNKKEGNKNVKVRLDRAVASPSWTSLFPDANVTHLVSSRSDHCPILIDLEKYHNRQSARRPWRYEIMWEREAFLFDEIEASWNSNPPARNMKDINTKLNCMRGSLNDWKNRSFGSVGKEIKNLKRELQNLMFRNDRSMNFRRKEINRRLDELLLREELMWKQRSRLDWLCEGDQNTKYFHQRATWRAKKNRISKLSNGLGKTTTNMEEMKEIASSFFENLYLEDNNVYPNDVLNLISPRVTSEVNESLTK